MVRNIIVKTRDAVYAMTNFLILALKVASLVIRLPLKSNI
jgi:hypothetical protein